MESVGALPKAMGAAAAARQDQGSHVRVYESEYRPAAVRRARTARRARASNRGRARQGQSYVEYHVRPTSRGSAYK